MFVFWLVIQNGMDKMPDALRTDSILAENMPAGADVQVGMPNQVGSTEQGRSLTKELSSDAACWRLN